MPSLDIITFGCRLNAFESEVMRGAADAAGLDEAVIVNTCAVTEEAERRGPQANKRGRRGQPQGRLNPTRRAPPPPPGNHPPAPQGRLLPPQPGQPFAGSV